MAIDFKKKKAEPAMGSASYQILQIPQLYESLSVADTSCRPIPRKACLSGEDRFRLVSPVHNGKPHAFLHIARHVLFLQLGLGNHVVKCGSGVDNGGWVPRRKDVRQEVTQLIQCHDAKGYID